MCGDDTHALLQGGRPAVHDQGEGQHGPGEVFDRNLDDDEGDALAAVVCRVGVGEGEDEGVGEDGRGEKEAGSGLFSREGKEG